MKEKVHKSWHPILGQFYQEPLSSLGKILSDTPYYPSRNNILRVFEKPLEEVKVVILGQDPYPSPGDAVGLSFVNGNPNKIPASLRIIYKELENEGFTNHNINNWSEQGVFLLNTALTVERGNAGSHLHYWKPFTEFVIKLLSKENPCIWILWGKKAQEFKTSIHNPYIFQDMNLKMINDLPIIGNYNYVLESPHPAAEVYSGGNAGFYGNNHFVKANAILKKQLKTEIIW